MTETAKTYDDFLREEDDECECEGDWWTLNCPAHLDDDQ